MIRQFKSYNSDADHLSCSQVMNYFNINDQNIFIWATLNTSVLQVILNSHQQIEMNKQKYVQEHGSYKAYFLMILSTFSFVLMELCFKQLTKYFNPILILSLRACFIQLFNLILMSNMGVSLQIKNPESKSFLLQKVFRMLLKRSSVNFIAGALYIGSIKYIPIGIANALYNTTPIMTYFIQKFYYKKVDSKFHWINLLITMICFTGVVLIIQPQFLFGSKSSHQGSSNIYYVMVLLGSFFSSLSAIFMHDLSGKVHELVALQYGYLFQGFCNCLIYITFFGNSPESVDQFADLPWVEIRNIFILFVLLILFAFGAHYLKTISFFMCYPAIVLPFNYLTIIFGLIIDLLVFSSKSYNILIVLGMILAGCGLFSKFVLLMLKRIKQIEIK